MNQIMNSSNISIVIADSMTLCRKGLKSLLSSYPFVTILAEGSNLEVVLKDELTQQPDFIISELVALLNNDASMLKAIRSKWRNVRIIGLIGGTAQSSAFTLAKQSGVSMIIRRTDSPIEMLKALGIFVLPETSNTKMLSLSKREIEVAERIRQGETNKKIGDSLELTEQSIKNIVSRILRKLNLSNRVQIALFIENYTLTKIK